MCNDFQVQKNLWIIISGVLQEDLLQAYNTLTTLKTVNIAGNMQQNLVESMQRSSTATNSWLVAMVG